jgi:two-component system OmpR family sensor kinase
MPDEVREHLFEPFYRGPDRRTGAASTDAPTTDDALGQHLGLGLAIVAALVRAHEGRIEVRSALGKGSRFTVHLPG